MTATEPEPAVGLVSEAWGELRTKTISWHDPAPAAAAAAGLSGLEFLSAMRDGRIPPPPISQLFDFRPIEVTTGDVVFSCLPDESAYNPIGMVHGGLLCTILDTATACAVHTTLAAGVIYTSIEIKVNYLRPVHVVDGRPTPLTAHGWVTRPGRRVAFAEGDVRDAQGKLVATASSTCLIMGPTA